MRDGRRGPWLPLVALLAVAGRLDAEIIETIAGGGVGDGLPAVAQAVQPAGIAVDARGNVYVAEGYRARVRRVDATTGVITTVAGTGPRPVQVAKPPAPYFCGDGGPAVDACLDDPIAVAVDRHGNVLVADDDTNRVRRVDAATGVITTIAGNGAPLPCAYRDGPATDACLVGPTALGLGTGDDVYVGDWGRVLRLDTGGMLTTVAGGGDMPCSAGGPASALFLDYVTAVAADAAGNLFVADDGEEVVCRIDAATGRTSVVGEFDARGLAFDAAGNLYVADHRRDVLRRLDAGSSAAGAFIGVEDSTYCQPAPDGDVTADTCIGAPDGVAVDSAGNVLFIGAYGVRRVDPAARRLTTVAGNGTPTFCGDGGPATNACLDDLATGIAVDSRGNVLVADYGYARVRRVDARTHVIDTILASRTDAFCAGSPPGSPVCDGGVDAVAVDPQDAVLVGVARDEGGWVLRIDPQTDAVVRVAGGGDEFAQSFCGDGGPAIDACLDRPASIAVDAAGDFFLADSGRIRRIDAVSQIIATVAGGNGTSAYCGDGGPATAACVQTDGVAVGPDGSLYIADSRNGRVRRVDPASGIIASVAGNGPPPGSPFDKRQSYFCGDGGPATSACLYDPQAVLVDPAGNLLIADTGNARVRRVDARTGVITTVAGSGTSGYCGDGGPPGEACLADPLALAMEPGGALLVLDGARVRRIRCDDGDGDGVCDAYDMSDLPGMQLAKASVGRPKKDGSVRVKFRARIAGGRDSAAAAFVQRVRQTGVSFAVYAGSAEPTPQSAPFARVSVGADACRVHRRRIRCVGHGSPAGSIDLRIAARTGTIAAVGVLHVPGPTTAPAGPLQLILDANDSLQFAGRADHCGANGICRARH